MISKIKIIILCIVTVVLIILSTTVAVQNKRISSLNASLSSKTSNEKALLLKSDGDKNEIRSLQFTIEQLNYFNDSVVLELNKARQELNIKDKDLK
jgi:TolA-binding protein